MNDGFLIVESTRDPGWQKVSHFMPNFTSSAQEAAQAAAQISREQLPIYLQGLHST